MSLKMPGYRGGHIKKISVTNFMTYDRMVLNAKPGLNLILGLNGSGKSSIMNAICLGLAGKPIYTGRPGNLSDFIKYGCEKAIVEIELDNPFKRNITIKRIIQGDKSTWVLNGSTVSLNEVQNVVKKFNIDISNLCQFLPQEKVTEFSKMDKKQRLENMLQAIGEPRLFTLFKDLKQLKEKCLKLEDDIKLYQNHRNNEDQINKRIKIDVEKQEERMRLKCLLENLKQNKKILIYENKRNYVDRLKKEKEPLQHKCDKLKKAIEELTSSFESKTETLKKNAMNMRDLKIKLVRLQEKISQIENEMLQLQEKAHEAKIYYNNRIEEKRNQKQKLNEIERQLHGLEGVIKQNRAELPKIEEQDRILTQELERIKNELANLSSELASNNIEKNNLEYKIQNYVAHIERMKNEENKKMEHLRARFSDVYEAVVWLQENRDKFRATVYPPMLLLLKLNHDDNRKYIEGTVALRDMIAFICEDKEDNKLLTNILRVKKKLNVNIVMVPDTPATAYQTDTLTPELRQLGIECFLSNIVEAPSAVMKFLCEVYHLNKIPLVSAAGNSNMERILQRYRTYFTSDERVSGRRSKYGARHMTIKKDPVRGTNLLPSSTDHTEQLQQLIAKCEEEKRIVINKRKELSDLEANSQNLEREENSYRHSKRQLIEKKNDINNTERQFVVKRDLYKRKKVELIDEEEEKKKLYRTINDANNLRKKFISEIVSTLQSFLNLKKQKLRFNLQARLVTKANTVITKFLREKEEEMRETKENREELQNEIKKLKEEAKIIYEEIKSFLPDDDEERISGSDYQLRNKLPNFELDDNSLPCIPKSIIKAHLERISASKLQRVEDIDREINRVNAQLHIDSEENEGILKEYKDREAKIGEITKDIEDHETQLTKVQAEMAIKKEEWLPALEKHIRNINAKFSHHYKQLKCAGEISLDTCDNTDDFPKYGLQLRLKYRDNEPFMELSNTHHSGGECSVAAIIFILSLQELTEVPFRCIDEINQGMDSTNERNIYTLIAENAESSSCSQYFLLTPKLLMDLEMIEKKRATVHTIFNSSFLKLDLNVLRHLEIVEKDFSTQSDDDEDESN